MRAFRVADRRFPIFDGTGARLAGGRWNSSGHAIIYAAETYSGALLEVLVHSNLGRLPKTQAVVEITIPDNIAIEMLNPEAFPGWNAVDQSASRAFGDQWLQERRTVVLLVPSVVTGGRERNVLLNPEHPQFARVSASAPQNILWDARLSRRPK